MKKNLIFDNIIPSFYFIEYYLENNYKFVSPNDILKGLKKDERYVLITFDDGYYNNINALPVLKEYDVPAVFFVCINHIKQNRSFWWDIIYRERIKRRSTKEEILREVTSLEPKTNEEIEKHIEKAFGRNIFTPKSDIDRPFSPQELKEFANQKKHVVIGNHTMNHEVLPPLSKEKIEYEISYTQSEIKKIIGEAPIVISYPYGKFSNKVIRISKKCGLKLGVTSESKKNYLPIKDLFKIYRFALIGNNDMKLKCEMLHRI